MLGALSRPRSLATLPAPISAACVSLMSREVTCPGVAAQHSIGPPRSLRAQGSFVPGCAAGHTSCCTPYTLLLGPSGTPPSGGCAQSRCSFVSGPGRQWRPPRWGKGAGICRRAQGRYVSASQLITPFFRNTKSTLLLNAALAAEAATFVMLTWLLSSQQLLSC